MVKEHLVRCAFGWLRHHRRQQSGGEPLPSAAEVRRELPHLHPQPPTALFIYMLPPERWRCTKCLGDDSVHPLIGNPPVAAADDVLLRFSLWCGFRKDERP